MSEKQGGLYIPQGIKLREEIFNGYAREDLLKSLGVTGAVFGISVALYIIKRDITISAVLLLSGIFASVIIFTQDDNNLSMLDHIKLMIKYTKSQKRYRYHYMKEWGDI